jgi:hypothetical protein
MRCVLRRLALSRKGSGSHRIREIDTGDFLQDLGRALEKCEKELSIAPAFEASNLRPELCSRDRLLKDQPSLFNGTPQWGIAGRSDNVANVPRPGSGWVYASPKDI